VQKGGSTPTMTKLWGGLKVKSEEGSVRDCIGSTDEHEDQNNKTVIQKIARTQNQI